MIKKIIFTLVCLQASVFSSAQTEEQKQMIYERINKDSRGSGIMSKIEPIESKEVLFSKAQVLPIFKVEFNSNKIARLVQNKNYFLVFYLGRLYCFMGNKDSRFFENSPVIQNINQFNTEKKDFFVVYFTDIYSLDGIYLNPLLSDKSVSFIIDRGNKLATLDYIDLKYGSFDKYKENFNIDSLRNNLLIEDFNNYMKNNYEAFEYNCPKDTTLVLTKLMSQIRLSTKNFTKNQEVELLTRIKQKINPFELKIKQTKQILIQSKVNDSTIASEISKMKIENKKNKKENIRIAGLYEFSVYNVSFTNELLEVLTNEQFADYKRYYDLMHPVVETLTSFNNNKYRYGYAKQILEKENVLKSNSFTEYKKYADKIILDCGCPFDETIKREAIIR